MQGQLSVLGRNYRERVIELAEFAASADPETELLTYSLGSCVGLALYDPQAGVGGMAHFMLPWSRSRPGEAFFHPGMFVDTGLTALVREMQSLGAVKSRLVVKAAGCGQMFDSELISAPAEENSAALERILRDNGLTLIAAHVGGRLARSLRLSVASGKVTVCAGAREFVL